VIFHDRDGLESLARVADHSTVARDERDPSAHQLTDSVGFRVELCARHGCRQSTAGEQLGRQPSFGRERRLDLAVNLALQDGAEERTCEREGHECRQGHRQEELGPEAGVRHQSAGAGSRSL
jgi:hypothetical protein